jgi:hypothetical protein
MRSARKLLRTTACAASSSIPAISAGADGCPSSLRKFRQASRDAIDERRHACLTRQSIEQLGYDVDSKLSCPIFGGDSFGAAFGFDLGFGGGAEFVCVGLGRHKKRSFRGRGLGFGRLQRLAAVLGEACGFRRSLVPFVLRRRLGGFCVGEQLSSRLLTRSNRVDHWTEQKVRQQPNQDDGIDGLKP